VRADPVEWQFDSIIPRERDVACPQTQHEACEPLRAEGLLGMNWKNTV